MQLYKVDLEGFDDMAQPYNIRFVEEKIDVVKGRKAYDACVYTDNKPVFETISNAQIISGITL